MRGISQRASEMKENLHFRWPPLQIFAAPKTRQLVPNQYYSSSWEHLLYESWVLLDLGLPLIFAFARQRGLRSNSKEKSLRELARTPKIIEN